MKPSCHCDVERSDGLALIAIRLEGALRLVLAVRLDLNTADEQRRQNGFGLIVRPNADATATRGNVCVIMRWDLVPTTRGRVHDKRLKWLSSQPVPKVLRHVPNVSKRSPGCNYWPRFAERKAQPRRGNDARDATCPAPGVGGCVWLVVLMLLMSSVSRSGQTIVQFIPPKLWVDPSTLGITFVEEMGTGFTVK